MEQLDTALFSFDVTTSNIQDVGYSINLGSEVMIQCAELPANLQ